MGIAPSMPAHMPPDELAAWLRLCVCEGVGAVAGRKLLRALGSPQAVFAASAATLRQLVNPAQATELLAQQPQLHAQLEATQRWMDTPLAPEHRGPDGLDSERFVLCLGDALYPKSLLALSDPPLLLYVHAQAGYWPRTVQALGERPNAVAVVGSRNASTQGANNAKAFSQSLCDAGWVIVSGLALGIDAAAHQGALAAEQGGAGTIAVIGTGIDRVYPKGNAALARQIVQGGAIVSEFAIGTPVLAHHFPKRNRLIAAFSRGTLVVEAAPHSGSLITARLAAELGRDVFAIPGSIHSTHSKGCHALIKQGAALVETAQDVLDAPGFGLERQTVATDVIATNAMNSATESQNTQKMTGGNTPEPVWLQRMGHDPVSLDELVSRTGENAAWLQALLLEHELMGQVERLPGNRYQRVGFA